MKHTYPYLKETKGSVVNFASGAGLFGKPGQSSYAAAKEGIRGMSRVAATEWGPDGINVNIICPLVMSQALMNWKAQYPESEPFRGFRPAGLAIRRRTSAVPLFSSARRTPSIFPARPSPCRAAAVCARKCGKKAGPGAYRARPRFRGKKSGVRLPLQVLIELVLVGKHPADRGAPDIAG